MNHQNMWRNHPNWLFNTVKTGGLTWFNILKWGFVCGRCKMKYPPCFGPKVMNRSDTKTGGLGWYLILEKGLLSLNKHWEPND